MLEPVPAGVPPHETVNHSHIAPVPSDPPVTDKVFDVPKQVLLLVIVTPVGAVDKLPTVTASVLGALVPQEFEAVTVIFPLSPVLPVVSEMEFVVDVPVQPEGKVQI
jgi:hypothetical protein